MFRIVSGFTFGAETRNGNGRRVVLRSSLALFAGEHIKYTSSTQHMVTVICKHGLNSTIRQIKYHESVLKYVC